MAPKGKKDQSEEVKRFVSINEYNPESTKKLQLVWTIVAFFTVVLVIFWFWSIKQGLDSKIKEQRNELNIAEELGDAINEVKDNFGNIKETFKQTTDKIEEQVEANTIKDNVLSQIQNNIDKLAWSEYSSEINNITLKHPNIWTTEETSDYLTISNYLTSSSTTSTIASIRTIKHDNPEKLELMNWAIVNKTSIVGEWAEISNWIDTIDSRAIVVYQNTNSLSSEKIILFATEDKIYDIEWFIAEGKDTDELVKEMIKMLQSITIS